MDDEELEHFLPLTAMMFAGEAVDDNKYGEVVMLA